MEWACASCAGENPSGTRFCGWCGVRRADETDAAPVVDERRLVTSLFADISGFTTLADTLDDPEKLHEVIEPVIAGIAAVAERYEGFIAKYAGDALLVFFGAPIAHEDDPARALLVASEMHAALPGLLEQLPPEAQGLELHIGVNTGRVIAGLFGGEVRSDYSILGDAVILAQRLESVCPSGETYVGESTVELTKSDFDFDAVGELTLKGKLRPVPAWRLIGRKATAPRLRRGRALVGRDAELLAVEAMLAPLAAGRGGGIVTVGGDPGVGKTRLLAEVRNRAERRGIRWLETRCPSYGASLPYWPVAELVRQQIGIRIENRPDEARRLIDASEGVTPERAPYLARLVGATAGDDEFGGLDAEEMQRRLHSTVIDWVLALSEGHPLVLAVEDIHWADAASAAVAFETARVSQGWPVGLYLTARPEGADALDAIASEVEPAWRTNIELAAFEGDGITGFLRGLLESEPPDDLVRVVEDRTGGNPLFMEEIVRSLLDERALLERNGQWTLDAGFEAERVPDSAERLLAARIDRLPSELAGVLQTASVIGRLVRLPILRAVADEDPELDDRLNELADAGFLDPVDDGGQPAMLFHHALVQEVAYERMLRRRRRELHLRVARAAEGLYGAGDDVIDLLARHYWLAEAGATAVDYLVRAGERSRRLYANDEAILHLERAARVAREEGVDGRRLADIVVTLAAIREVHGDYERAIDLYDEAVALDDANMAALVGHAMVLRQQGEYQSAVQWVDRALEIVEPGRDEAALWLERGSNLSLEGRHDEAVEAFRQGLELAGDDDALTGRLLLGLAGVSSMQGRSAEALDFATRARDVIEQADDLLLLTEAWREIGNTHRETGELEPAAEALRRSLELAQRTGAVVEVAGALLNLGMIELERGDLDAAIDLDRRAVAEFDRIDHLTGRMIGYANLAEKLLLFGEVGEAELWCERALEKGREAGHAAVVADATRTLARIRDRQDRLGEARALATEAAGRFRDLGMNSDADDCAALARAIASER